MIQSRADGQMRLAFDVGPHQGAILPGGDAPPGVVRTGERVRAKGAVGLLRLLDGGDCVAEELIQEGKVLSRSLVTTMTARIM